MSAHTISESAESVSMSVHSVGILSVNGGRFAEIRYGFTGAEMSVQINGADPVASLFASADAECAAARNCLRRAMRMRNAAWMLSKERTNAA